MPDTSTAPPTQIGKYQLGAEIGRGACGVVYIARDPFVQRNVALKLANDLAPPAVQASDTAAPQWEQTFFAEAHAAGRLQHPNIVTVHDAGIDQRRGYIVMEYVDGCTLSRFRDGDLAQIVGLLIECARALDYAHRHDILHRDIKPGNIMLTRDGVPKILDFGIAALMQDQRFRPDKLQGSPSYMAPEQIAAGSIGPASDLYALGAVAFELLTGRPPYSGDTRDDLIQNIRFAPVPALGRTRLKVPDALAEIVHELLAKTPEGRPASGQTLVQALLKVHDRRRVQRRTLRSRKERDTLRGLPFFAEFSDEEIDELFAAGSLETIAAGDTLLRAGGTKAGLILIVRGEAELRKAGRALCRLGSNQVLGGLGLPVGGKSLAEVIAQSDTLLLSVPGKAVRSLSDACQHRLYKACCESLNYRVALLTARAAG